MNNRTPQHYKMVMFWGHSLGSYQYYIRQEMERACQENAPLDAIYRRENGEWARWCEIKNTELKNRLACRFTEYLTKP